MNKKQIDRIILIIKVMGGITTIILGWRSVYKKSLILFFINIIILLFLLVIYFACLSYSKEASEKKVSRLEKENKELKDEIQIFQSDTCKECRKIYDNITYETVSFSENLDEDKNFSLIEGIGRRGEVMMFHLDDQWIYIRFLNKEQGDYLIDLIGQEIYLPVSEWQIFKRDELLSYRILCSERRKKHFRREIDKLI